MHNFSNCSCGNQLNNSSNPPTKSQSQRPQKQMHSNGKTEKPSVLGHLVMFRIPLKPKASNLQAVLGSLKVGFGGAIDGGTVAVSQDDNESSLQLSNAKLKTANHAAWLQRLWKIRVKSPNKTAETSSFSLSKGPQ